MKQTLQLKLSQHLTLTPQLQQSIRLLQLSTVELNAEEERMLQGVMGRIRDVRNGPDGFLYLLTDESPGVLVRRLAFPVPGREAH